MPFSVATMSNAPQSSRTTSSETGGGCVYCGLPVPQPLWGKPSEGANYCCTGCRFAHAVTQESGAEGEARWTLTKLGISIFFSMNVMVLTLALWAYTGPQADGKTLMAHSLAEVFRFACLLLSFPVLVLLGRPLLEQAIDSISQRRLTTDILIVGGVLASFVYSTISVWSGTGEIYFEVGCMILVFVTLGRWLEATGKLRSTEALDQLQQLLPDEVDVLQADKSRLRVARSELNIGDEVIVQAGDRIPIDGRITQGRSTIDEQLVTGESWPVERTVSQTVVGGTLALDGEIVVRIEHRLEDGTLPRLVAAIHAARQEKGEYQRLADRISQIFVIVTAGLSLSVLIFHSFNTDLMTGVMAALSVVLIACPCALGIATPLALWASIGVAAQRGIVFGTTTALEQLAKVKAIRFDKTGTLTTGQPQVKRLLTDGQTDVEAIRQRADALARSSNHVFSQAISESLKSTDLPTSLSGTKSVEIEATSVAGKGMYGVAHGEFQPTALGNKKLMDEFDFECPPTLELAIEKSQQEGHPCILVGWGGLVRGCFIMQEELRSSAMKMLSECRSKDLDLAVLTGDTALSTNRLASTISTPFLTDLSPERKQQAILNAQSEIGPVAFLGDGINDAIALSTADVGISLGCGADVSREAADICLVSDDLSQMPWLVDLSQATVQTIRTNLFWAFGYNGCGMLVAATGWLHPAVSAVLMVLSSLFVISNSLRLRAQFSSDSLGEIPIEGDYQTPMSHSAVADHQQSLVEVS